MRLAVARTGYVGLSLAVLLAQHSDVTAVDVVADKVERINTGVSPIRDPELVVVATPTNYDLSRSYFDTHFVEDVIGLVLSVKPTVSMVVKSTVPVGYTRSLLERWPDGRFLFSPEFLREGRALYDNLHPSRIMAESPPRAPADRGSNHM